MLHSKIRPVCSCLRRVPTWLLVVSTATLLVTTFLIYRRIDRSVSPPGPKVVSGESSTLQLDTANSPLQTNDTTSTMTRAQPGQIVLLVIAANRPKAVRSHLEQLVKLRPSATRFPIVVSQDGDSADVTQVISGFVDSMEGVHFINRRDRETLDNVDKVTRSYIHISQHYKWALDNVFTHMRYELAIVTEEDLDIADDFFSYFTAAQRLLYVDPTIWCVSAWNDNGAVARRDHNGRLYRTDFFPGLGWMLRRELWEELSPKWPRAYWDDWMRQQDVRRERVCVRPEVSRTLHNMSLAGKGTSNGLYKSYLTSIRLPEKPVDFSYVDMKALEKNNYDSQLERQLRDAEETTVDALTSDAGKLNATKSYRVVYSDPRQFRRLTSRFKLMMDIRSGMPRTAYYGVVAFTPASTNITVYAVHPRLQQLLNQTDVRFGQTPSSEIYDHDWDLMSKYLDFAEIYCRPNRWTGKCDPSDPEMVKWFEKRSQLKRLRSWGKMLVF